MGLSEIDNNIEIHWNLIMDQNSFETYIPFRDLINQDLYLQPNIDIDQINNMIYYYDNEIDELITQENVDNLYISNIEFFLNIELEIEDEELNSLENIEDIELDFTDTDIEINYLTE